MAFNPQRPSLFGETLESLQEQIQAAGFKGFRAKQVMNWIYKKRVDSWDAMFNLPKDFRSWLERILFFIRQTQLSISAPMILHKSCCLSWRINL